MALLAKLRSYANSLLHREQREDEFQQEIAFHISCRAEDLERGGLSAAEALRQAKIEFGGVESHRAEVRASLGLRWFDELRDDLRYAWRMLAQSKGFATIAVGSLALGIGANTIIFSLAKGMLLDRLAVPHSEQLRFLSTIHEDRTPLHSSWGDSKGKEMLQFSYPIFKLLQQQNRDHPVLQDLFAFKFLNLQDRLAATFDGRAELLNGQMVSGNFYEQLGVRPQLGRTIHPSDDGAPGTGNVIMLSDSCWTRLFGRSPGVIGKTIELNLVPVTIIGVNPRGFTGAGSVQIEPDIFFPLSMQPLLRPMGGQRSSSTSVLEDKELWWVQIIARARPGTSSATAKAALQTWLDEDIRATMPVDKDALMPEILVGDGSRGMAHTNREYSVQLWVLSALAGMVLLLACANLATLLLARSATRQREMAVRLALGASRTRLLRQVLTESLLLSSMGGAAGLLLGYLGRDVIPHMYAASQDGPMLRADFDAGIFLFTGVIAILTGVLFGVAPAWQAIRTPVNTGLKNASDAVTRRRKGVAGRGLVTVQIALSMLLVVGAGLFCGTLRHLYREQMGFKPDHLFVFAIGLPDKRYPAPKDVQLHARLEERLSGVPGVISVGLTTVPVLAGTGWNQTFRPTDQKTRQSFDGNVNFNSVGSSFFDSYGIPVLYGREIRTTDTSTSQRVAVVNEALVRDFWPQGSAIGKSFAIGPEDKPTLITIVGVVGDAKYSSLDSAPPPTVYLPYMQADSAEGMFYTVKSMMDAPVLEPRIRAAIGEIDRDLVLRDVRTLRTQIDGTTAQQRVFAMLTAAFGALALVLACIGVYGLMAYDVARRTNEIGIRMALGARAGQMLRMVLREASWTAIAGITIGLGSSLWLAKFVKSMLYRLAPDDPWILGGAGLLLLIVAVLAAFGPARRASRVEPMVALRHE